MPERGIDPNNLSALAAHYEDILASDENADSQYLLEELLESIRVLLIDHREGR